MYTGLINNYVKMEKLSPSLPGGHLRLPVENRTWIFCRDDIVLNALPAWEHHLYDLVRKDTGIFSD